MQGTASQSPHRGMRVRWAALRVRVWHWALVAAGRGQDRAYDHLVDLETGRRR